MRATPKTLSRISITPLVDIVFILLLFFILATNFMRFGAVAVDAIPGVARGEAATEVLVIEALAGGNFWLGGERVELAGLAEAVGRIAPAADTPVLLATAGEVHLQQLVGALDVLRGFGLTRVRIDRLQE